MAETRDLAPSLLESATCALQCSTTLYETLQSYQTRPKRVRDLEGELEALRGVLSPLIKTISSSDDVAPSVLSGLDFPLRRCGNACREFGKALTEHASPSDSRRTSSRDWPKPQHFGVDIDGFRRLVAVYKLTIEIVDKDANFSMSSMTAENLEIYRNLIEGARDDIEDRLAFIDERIGPLSGQIVTTSDSDAERLREDRLSVAKCQKICAKLSNRISTMSPNSQSGSDSLPERVTSEGLQGCKGRFDLLTEHLERRLQTLLDQLAKTPATISDARDLKSIWEQLKLAGQCKDVCVKAKSEAEKNIIENYAKGDDAIQLVVSGWRALHGMNRGLGQRTKQVGGYLSEECVLQLVRNWPNINSQEGDHDSGGNASSGNGGAVEGEPIAGFTQTYGPGFKLPPK